VRNCDDEPSGHPSAVDTDDLPDALNPCGFAVEEEWDICPETRGDGRQSAPRDAARAEVPQCPQHSRRITASTAEPTCRRDGLVEMEGHFRPLPCRSEKRAGGSVGQVRSAPWYTPLGAVNAQMYGHTARVVAQRNPNAIVQCDRGHYRVDEMVSVRAAPNHS
jgi:hypothetical protein